MILDDASLKMSKNYFYLCSCMRGLRPAYAAYIHAYVVLFLCMQVYFLGSTYVGWTCICRILSAYVRCLAKALLCPFSLIFNHFTSTSNPNTFLSFLHMIIIISFFLSSFLHQNIIFSKFYLNLESNVIFFFFAFIIPLCWQGKHQ